MRDKEKEVKHILDAIKESKNLIYSNCNYLELDYKEQQALNDYINELKREIEELNHSLRNSRELYYLECDKYENSISKDKIRDIIEFSYPDFAIQKIKELLEE